MYFISPKSYLHDTKTQYCLVIPEITDLESSVRQRQKTNNWNYQQFLASGYSDAGFRLLTQQATLRTIQQNNLKRCQVITFGQTQWTGFQKIRKNVEIIQITDKVIKNYRLCDRYFPERVGVKLAIALLSQPSKSVTLRKIRRFKFKKSDRQENTRPDFQEILTGIELIIWVNSEEDTANPNLCDRLNQAFANPASVNRFGALCLGESRDLVDRIALLSENERFQSLQWLMKDEYGYLSLPYWVDRVGSKKTLWLRYALENREQQQPSDSSWTIIQTI